MASQLARANLVLLSIALVLYFVAITLGAVKWQILVHAQGLPGSLGELLSYSMVGLFFGNLLPSNVGGDIVRAFGLMRASERAEAAAISVLVDRLMGLVAYLGAAVVMAIVATVTLTRGAELEQIEVATALVAGLFIVVSALIFSHRFSQQAKRLFDFPFLIRIRPIAARVYEALQVYRRSYRALAANVMISALGVLLTTCIWYTVALALNIRISFFYFLLFNPLISFVVLIPISLNGLGPKEAVAVFFFGLVGVSGEAALSMSLVFHLLIILTSLPGGILWWRARARHDASRRHDERAPEKVTEPSGG